MAVKNWFMGVAATALAAGAMLATPVHAATSISVQIAPPPPQTEVIPAPRPGNVWVPGHWRWSGSQHVWVPGHYQARRAGMIYAPARWVQVGGRWEYREGLWVRPGAGYRDTDGDGIADRFDRDRDGDGIPNAVDPNPNRVNAPAPGGVYVQTAPPPLRVEPVPVRRAGQVWVPGHWRWNGSQHVWIAGHYQAMRAGWIYAPARWVDAGGRWQFREGTWVRPGAGYRDTDGDGIADRFDNDRDGDGVRNSRDAAPGNPNSR